MKIFKNRIFTEIEEDEYECNTVEMGWVRVMYFHDYILYDFQHYSVSQNWNGKITCIA